MTAGARMPAFALVAPILPGREHGTPARLTAADERGWHVAERTAAGAIGPRR